MLPFALSYPSGTAFGSFGNTGASAVLGSAGAPGESPPGPVRVYENVGAFVYIVPDGYSSVQVTATGAGGGGGGGGTGANGGGGGGGGSRISAVLGGGLIVPGAAIQIAVGAGGTGGIAGPGNWPTPTWAYVLDGATKVGVVAADNFEGDWGAGPGGFPQSTGGAGGKTHATADPRISNVVTVTGEAGQTVVTPTGGAGGRGAGSHGGPGGLASATKIGNPGSFVGGGGGGVAITGQQGTGGTAGGGRVRIAPVA